MPSEDRIDRELLRRVQLVLAEVLREFDRVCRELEIPYVVYGGTAIGAVRHKGFIPWDDDVDVCLLREDYERFLREAPGVLGSEFALDNVDTNSEFPFMFTKMVLKDTLLVPEAAKETKYRMPVFVDIIPFDPIPDDPRLQKLQIAQTWFWGRLLFLQGTGRPFLTIQGPLRTAVYAATGLIHRSIGLLGIKPKTLQRKWEQAARKYEGKEGYQFADFTMQDPRPWALSAEELYPAIDARFEDIIVKLPKEYDALLRRGYGDYMQLPPEDERGGHELFLVDLGEYDPVPVEYSNGGNDERGPNREPTYGSDGYQPDELERLHTVLLQGLVEFDRVCRELGTPYALFAGSAIGAVRHQGFIPWDDDIDVCMERCDYQRFLKGAPGILRSGFSVDSIESDPKYPNTFANLSLAGTEFISEVAKDRPYRMPLGIDIFPLDKAAPTARGFKKQMLATTLWGRLLFLHGCPRPNLQFPLPLRQIALAIMSATHTMMKVTGVSTQTLQRKWEKAARRFEDSNGELLVDFAETDPARWSVRRNELFPTVDGTFEGLTVSLPKEYDRFLTRIYGNYMEIPPPSERVNHRPYHIDLGRYAEGGRK